MRRKLGDYKQETKANEEEATIAARNKVMHANARDAWRINPC